MSVCASCGGVVLVRLAQLVDKFFGCVFVCLYVLCVLYVVFRVVVCVGWAGLVGGQVKRSCWPAAQYDRQ